jgi:hypothetical protein
MAEGAEDHQVIEEGVAELFKAALTQLMNDPTRRVTAFQIGALSSSGQETIDIFLIRDPEVSKLLLKNFDEMAKDHGGRKAVEIRIEIHDPPKETPGNGN